jgi:hypothetical protein
VGEVSDAKFSGSKMTGETPQFSPLQTTTVPPEKLATYLAALLKREDFDYLTEKPGNLANWVMNVSILRRHAYALAESAAIVDFPLAQIPAIPLQISYVGSCGNVSEYVFRVLAPRAVVTPGVVAAPAGPEYSLWIIYFLNSARYTDHPALTNPSAKHIWTFLAETAAMATDLFNDEAYIDFVYRLGRTRGGKVDARQCRAILAQLKSNLAAHGFNISLFGDDDWRGTSSQMRKIRQAWKYAGKKVKDLPADSPADLIAALINIFSRLRKPIHPWLKTYEGAPDVGDCRDAGLDCCDSIIRLLAPFNDRSESMRLSWPSSENASVAALTMNPKWDTRVRRRLRDAFPGPRLHMSTPIAVRQALPGGFHRFEYEATGSDAEKTAYGRHYQRAVDLFGAAKSNREMVAGFQESTIHRQVIAEIWLPDHHVYMPVDKGEKNDTAETLERRRIRDLTIPAGSWVAAGQRPITFGLLTHSEIRVNKCWRESTRKASGAKPTLSPEDEACAARWIKEEAEDAVKYVKNPGGLRLADKRAIYLDRLEEIGRRAVSEPTYLIRNASLRQKLIRRISTMLAHPPLAISSAVYGGSGRSSHCVDLTGSWLPDRVQV